MYRVKRGREMGWGRGEGIPSEERMNQAFNRWITVCAHASDSSLILALKPRFSEICDPPGVIMDKRP
jgi:hypothetical protein